MTKMLADMTGEELADVLREMADRVQQSVADNRVVVEKLRAAAQELESKRRNPDA